MQNHPRTGRGGAAFGRDVDNPSHNTPPHTDHRTLGRETDRKNPRERVTLENEVLIARWQKNRHGRCIAIRLKTVDGYNIADLRTFFAGSGGGLRPGKGFTCSVDHLPRLAEEFANALKRARELGLIGSEGDA